MIKYIIFRIFWLIFTLLLVITALFFILRFIELRYSDIAFIEKLFLVNSEYIVYLKGIFTSFYWGSTDSIQAIPVLDLLRSKAHLTMRIAVLSLAFFSLFGILFGTLGAIFKDRLIDKIINFFILIFTSLPAFLLVMLLVLFFGYYLEWLPPINPSITRGYWYYIRGLIIPVLAISGFPLAQMTRLIRGEMIELYHSDFLMLLKTKGLSDRQAILRHFLKDSVVTMLPEMMPMVLYVIVTSFIVEKVYNIQGLANWLFDSLFRPIDDTHIISIHLPSVVIIGAFYTLITLICSFIIDLLQVWMDPRIRLTNNKSNLT